MSAQGEPSQPGGRHYRVTHRTTYRYSRPMNDGYSVAFVVPRTTPHQHVHRAEVVVEPAPDERVERFDVFGNRLLQFGIHHQHDALTVSAQSDVTTRPIEVAADGLAWERVVAEVTALRGHAALDVRPFAGGVPLVTSPDDRAELHRLAGSAFVAGRPIVDAALALCHEISTTYDYDKTYTEVSTPLSAVLAGHRGVCQDFAHLTVSALRQLGLAARYVSGYLETQPPDGTKRLVGADATHAWCAVWAAELGWIDFDPTNDRFPVDRHITVAWGRDYGDVAPVRGVVIGPPASQQLEVSVDVERLEQPPIQL